MNVMVTLFRRKKYKLASEKERVRVVLNDLRAHVPERSNNQLTNETVLIPFQYCMEYLGKQLSKATSVEDVLDIERSALLCRTLLSDVIREHRLELTEDEEHA